MPVYFLTASSGNFTVPSDCRKFDYIDCIAGGGGGAAGMYAAYQNGGGGQGGGFSRRVNVAVTPGSVLPYSVGMGGAAVASGNPGYVYAGNAGGNTWFWDGSICWALGGAGGRNDGASHPSNAGGTGDLKYSGGSGGPVSGDAMYAGTGGGGAGGPNGPGNPGQMGTNSTKGTYGGSGDNGYGGAAGAGVAGGTAGNGSHGQEYGTNVGSGGGGGGSGGLTGVATAGAAGAWGGGGGGAFIQASGAYAAYAAAGYQGLIIVSYTPYVPKPPTVLTLSKNTGGSSGGQSITLNGTNFVTVPVTAVKFGAVNATSFTVVSDTQINCVTPPQPPGTVVTVTATNADGTSGPGPSNSFTYLPPAIGVNFAMMGM